MGTVYSKPPPLLCQVHESTEKRHNRRPAYSDTRSTKRPSFSEKEYMPLYRSAIEQMLRTPIPCPGSRVTGRPFSKVTPGGQVLVTCKKNLPLFS